MRKISFFLVFLIFIPVEIFAQDYNSIYYLPDGIIGPLYNVKRDENYYIYVPAPIAKLYDELEIIVNRADPRDNGYEPFENILSINKAVLCSQDVIDNSTYLKEFIEENPDNNIIALYPNSLGDTNLQYYILDPVISSAVDFIENLEEAGFIVSEEFSEEIRNQWPQFETDENETYQRYMNMDRNQDLTLTPAEILVALEDARFDETAPLHWISGKIFDAVIFEKAKEGLENLFEIPKYFIEVNFSLALLKNPQGIYENLLERLSSEENAIFIQIENEYGES